MIGCKSRIQNSQKIVLMMSIKMLWNNSKAARAIEGSMSLKKSNASLLRNTFQNEFFWVNKTKRARPEVSIPIISCCI